LLADFAGGWRARADENGAYRRRPPLAASVGGRDTVLVECPRDLGQPAATRVLQPDPVDDPPRQGWRAPWRTGLAALSWRLEVLAEETVEFGDRDQPLTPGRLHGAHDRDDAAVDRRDANPERFGGLPAAVGEGFGFSTSCSSPGGAEMRFGSR
jgi:hypothetical protein